MKLWAVRLPEDAPAGLHLVGCEGHGDTEAAALDYAIANSVRLHEPEAEAYWRANAETLLIGEMADA